MITKYGFIFLSPGADPAMDRSVIETGGQRTTLVAVPGPERVVDTAEALSENGAELIELCGAFGPVWTAKVIEAVGPGVAVGAVGYGAESVDRLAALTADV